MAAAGRSPASSGRRGRRGRGRGWSKSRKNPPSSPASAAATEDPPVLFPPGAEVEVRVDDDGFHGSWFEATVVDFSPARGRRVPARYTVAYSHLLADDGGGVLAEHFAPSHTRPRPPPPPHPSSPLGVHDIVEAFHNDGWWSGIVAAVADHNDPTTTHTVTVAFPITREVIPFPPHLVRPRRDYVAAGGEWVPSRAVVAIQPKRRVKVYEVGEKVEVGRDRDVYGYSWFPATVTKVVDPLSYIVKYFDLELEGDAAWPEKDTEYLHWRFIRPAVEHVPLESEFKLGPGAVVEAYCDGAWSPGIVRGVVGEGEYEVSVDGKEAEVLVAKVMELLKPQYKWNGMQWKIVSRKRQPYLRRRSMSGRIPSSPVDVESSGDEHSHGRGYSSLKKSRNAAKRLRKESQQQELISPEGLVDVSIPEIYIPFRALCKSQETNHSPYSYSPLSGKNNLEVIPNSIGQTAIDQETLTEVLLDGQLNTPTSETCAVNARDTHLVAGRRKKIASACKSTAGQKTQERLLSVKGVKVKKDISNSERGKIHSIQELQRKHDDSDNSQRIKNDKSKEIICALTASVDRQASSKLNKQMSRQTRSGSNTIYKSLTKKKGSKKTSSSVQNRRRENLKSIKSCTQQDIDRSLEDTYQEFLPLIPPGFETIYHAEGTKIRDRLLDEDLTNCICQTNRNGGAPTDHAVIQVAKSRQVGDNYHNAASSHFTADNSKLRSCSLARCSIPSHLTSQISGHQVPFVKRSPAWSLVEASDVFNLVPQQPHFLPLQEYSVEMREGMALGLMVAFTTLVENIREASIEESTEFFADKMSTLCHLEANGFNVEFLQTRLTKMLEIKSKCSMYLGEINKLEAEVVGKTTSLCQIDSVLDEKDEAIGELEQQLTHLRQEARRIEKDREHEDAELLRLKSKCSGFEEACDAGVQQFQNLLDDLRCKKRLL